MFSFKKFQVLFFNGGINLVNLIFFIDWIMNKILGMALHWWYLFCKSTLFELILDLKVYIRIYTFIGPL